MATDLNPVKGEMQARMTAEATAAAQAFAERRANTYALWKILGPAVALLTLVAAATGYWLIRRNKIAAKSANGTPSIAVLPFVNMSPDKDQVYFSDGLAEQLLNGLAKTRGLRVAARASSFQFRGRYEDVLIVGEKLNVGNVLEGSVRKEGGRVRITAQLIKASDGFHLWSETYDRELNDVFAVQDDIARSVAASLKVPLLGGTSAAPAAGGKNAEAYNAYLQAEYFLNRISKEDEEKAVGYYQQAIKLDPNYALAWTGLSRAYSSQAGRGYAPVEESYRKAREAAERALALDANLAAAHSSMGLIKMLHDWDWAGADASIQRALALEPGNATVVYDAAALDSTLGRLEEALVLDRRAIELDPLSAVVHRSLGFHSYRAGRLDEARVALQKTLELNPAFPVTHVTLSQVDLAQGRVQKALSEAEREPHPAFRLYGLALAYSALGQKKESDAALAELIAKYNSGGAYQIAEVYAYRSEADHAMEWLERAYAQRDPGVVVMKTDPLLKNLRGDPRYAAFLKKIRLAD